MTVAFETERLRAERLDPARHAGELAVLHADGQVMATMGGGTATAEESAEWVERNVRHWDEHGFGILVFRERESGRFAGRGALRRIEIGGREEVEVGYAVAAELWGRGLATEMALGIVAFAEELGLRDLVAYTEPGNAASRRVMEKAGFSYERDVEHHGRAQVLYRRGTAA